MMLNFHPHLTNFTRIILCRVQTEKKNITLPCTDGCFLLCTVCFIRILLFPSDVLSVCYRYRFVIKKRIPFWIGFNMRANRHTIFRTTSVKKNKRNPIKNNTSHNLANRAQCYKIVGLIFYVFYQKEKKHTHTPRSLCTKYV